MKYFILISILLIVASSHSQNTYNSENFVVARNDLSTNNYEKDSTANALVIYDYGNSYVDKNTFKLKTEIKRKLKILNRKGFEKANVPVYLYNDGSRKEKILNISASTYNIENNEVTNTVLEANQIFEEKYNDHYTIVKFTFPNVKEGSVLSYSYTLETPYMFKYRGWDFQEDIPKLYSEYNTSIPANYEYSIKLTGYLKFDVHDERIDRLCLENNNGSSADCVHTTYIIKNIPAFKEENFMTTAQNYISRIDYELKTVKGFDGKIEHYTKTWKTVDSELKIDKDIGKQLAKNGAVKNLLNADILNEKNPIIKAKAIYSFVQNTYTWDNQFNIFKDVSIKNLIDTKSGSVSEINILLHNLLDENGIDVKPVLLSTRENGFTTKLYPVLSDFNYLIVQATIDGVSYLLDATDNYLYFGQLPFRCLNQDGRLLDFKNGSSWIDIAPATSSTIQYRITVSLDSEGIMSGLTEKKTTGYHALSLKKDFFKDKNLYLKSKQDKHPNIEFEDYQVKTKDFTDLEFLESTQIKQEADLVGDKLYINPFLFKFFEKNPFKLQERSYPIDFGYSDAYLYILKFNVDDDYQIVEIPKDLTQKLPNNTGTFILTTKIEGNEIQLYFKINFAQAIYNPEYYDSIKTFMGQLVDIQQNSLIVIKKK